ncbi:ABC transporter permease [Puia sp.]|uniref:ABC transporter permease n=1 Tax=Puia sp. TaxID=2045100 RepID=UPI002F40DDB8
MIKNWLLTAFRNLRKNRTASAINIFGLTVGLSSCLLIALFIRHELSYDDFEVRGPRIVRSIMGYRFNGGGDMQYGNFNSTKVATTFKRVFPEIESAVRMTDRPRVVSYQEKLFPEDRFMFADSSFFLVFSMPLIKGDPNTALSGPKKVVLTQSTARKYFGTTDPIGKILRVGTDSVDYQVTGLMADCPSNSQFKFDLLGSFSSLYANQDETYWDANYGTFFLLREKTSLPALQAKVTAFMKKEMEGKGAEVNFLLEPFMRIHLYSEYIGFEAGTSIVYIYILAGVALLILVIACSTYINLSTARSVDRAREVGVRKVIGAGKGQLFWQFIGESFLLCLVAVVLSLGVVAGVLPAFDRLADRELAVSGVFSAYFLGLALAIAVVVSLLAGSYPALVLSRFHPVKVLKGAFKNTRSGQGLRQSLIVFQFVISVFLIVSTFIMGQQLSYIRNKKLGYDRDHVVELSMNRKLLGQLDYLKAEFRRNNDVVSLSTCASSPVQIYGGYNMRNDLMPSSQQMAVFGNPVDEDYISTTGLQLVAGQGISAQDMKDAHPDEGPHPDTVTRPVYHFVLNELAAKELGWTPQQAVGKRMYMDDSRPGYVKGVVKDFNFQSLHNPIKGLVLFPAHRTDRLLVRITGQHLPATLDFLQSTWKRLAPGVPYEMHFLDENYNKVYASEQRLGTVMNLFSGIAIVLACLGLFGLSSYAAKQRVKEIGIRKVLGASLGNLAFLLSAGFVRLAGVAIVIAFPLAWWAMHSWLQDFVYRVAIGPWVFVGAGLMVMAVTLATVSIQAVKTALLNPVKNLKVE